MGPSLGPFFFSKSWVIMIGLWPMPGARQHPYPRLPPQGWRSAALYGFHPVTFRKGVTPATEVALACPASRGQRYWRERTGVDSEKAWWISLLAKQKALRPPCDHAVNWLRSPDKEVLLEIK